MHHVGMGAKRFPASYLEFALGVHEVDRAEHQAIRVLLQAITHGHDPPLCQVSDHSPRPSRTGLALMMASVPLPWCTSKSTIATRSTPGVTGAHGRWSALRLRLYAQQAGEHAALGSVRLPSPGHRLVLLERVERTDGDGVEDAEPARHGAHQPTAQHNADGWARVHAENGTHQGPAWCPGGLTAQNAFLRTWAFVSRQYWQPPATDAPPLATLTAALPSRQRRSRISQRRPP